MVSKSDKRQRQVRYGGRIYKTFVREKPREMDFGS